jgi:hypothetical protein
MDAAMNVRAAMRALTQRVLVLGVSTVYCTEPVERPGQSPFYNCVVEILTEMPPREISAIALRHSFFNLINVALAILFRIIPFSRNRLIYCARSGGLKVFSQHLSLKNLHPLPILLQMFQIYTT